jgi:hypothetical protein
VVPQDDLGAPASPSHTRSADPTVVGKALADDACTVTPPRGAVESRATSPPMADSRMENPSCAVEAGGASVRDIDPISALPGGAEALVRDQPQIDQAR